MVDPTYIDGAISSKTVSSPGLALTLLGWDGVTLPATLTSNQATSFIVGAVAPVAFSSGYGRFYGGGWDGTYRAEVDDLASAVGVYATPISTEHWGTLVANSPLKLNASPLSFLNSSTQRVEDMFNEWSLSLSNLITAQAAYIDSVINAVPAVSVVTGTTTSALYPVLPANPAPVSTPLGILIDGGGVDKLLRNNADTLLNSLELRRYFTSGYQMNQIDTVEYLGYDETQLATLYSQGLRTSTVQYFNDLLKYTDLVLANQSPNYMLEFPSQIQIGGSLSCSITNLSTGAITPVTIVHGGTQSYIGCVFNTRNNGWVVCVGIAPGSPMDSRIYKISYAGTVTLLGSSTTQEMPQYQPDVLICYSYNHTTGEIMWKSGDVPAMFDGSYTLRADYFTVFPPLAYGYPLCYINRLDGVSFQLNLQWSGVGYIYRIYSPDRPSVVEHTFYHNHDNSSLWYVSPSTMITTVAFPVDITGAAPGTPSSFTLDYSTDIPEVMLTQSNPALYYPPVTRAPGLEYGDMVLAALVGTGYPLIERRTTTTEAVPVTGQYGYAQLFITATEFNKWQKDANGNWSVIDTVAGGGAVPPVFDNSYPVGLTGTITYGGTQMNSPLLGDTGYGFGEAPITSANPSVLSPSGDIVINYPPVSYNMTNGTPAPLYPTYVGALVMDVQLKKWGKYKGNHQLILDYNPQNQSSNGSIPYSNFGVKAGTLSAAGAISLFDAAPTDSWIRYGKIGYYRAGATYIHEVQAHFRTASTGHITLEMSLDGRNIEVPSREDFTFTAQNKCTAYRDSAGKWHSITISGQWDLQYLEVRGTIGSRR